MKIESVTGKNWILKKFNTEYLKYIKENFFLDELTSKLLAIRNIKKEELQDFLNPVIKNILPNPNLLLDMEKTAKRTISAFVNDEKIGIFGDYDVDGASSTAILGRYFNELKKDFEIYIPDRKTEGYGPSIKGFENLINNKVKIIFTVDCGTSSFDAIDYANQKGVDVLVLDHHQSGVKLPNAFSVVNPNRIDDKSELNYLCASGVCFMFLVALNRELREQNWFKKSDNTEPNLINYLDLVSLGTVCDVVPLIGINRGIVKQGLKVLKSKKNLGLKTLIEMCKIESSPTTYHLGYVIGPRINAGGRVGKSEHGSNLLLNADPQVSYKIATDLDDYNKERQLLEKKLLENVIKKIKDFTDPVLVLSGENWHEGVIGIVASRIKEKFNKPTIIISIDKDISKASARSIVGFDIGSVIINGVQNNLLIKGGGHKMAGGFSIETDKIDDFKQFVIKKFKIQNIDTSVSKRILIDSVITPSAINLEFFDKLNNLAPFGSGNPEPRFFIEGLKSVNSKIVGEKHIKSVLLGKDGTTIKTMAFNAVESDIGAYLLDKRVKPFNIVGKLTLNEWKGVKNVEFIIDDISVNKTHEVTVPSSIG
jgi:single-stranded-DNA-specific exonuclease